MSREKGKRVKLPLHQIAAKANGVVWAPVRPGPEGPGFTDSSSDAASLAVREKTVLAPLCGKHSHVTVMHRSGQGSGPGEQVFRARESVISWNTHIHTDIYTQHTHIHTTTATSVYIHTYSYTQTHTHCSHMHTHTDDTCTLMHIHVCTSAHAHVCTHTSTAHTYTCTLVTHTYTHTTFSCKYLAQKNNRPQVWAVGLILNC